MKSVYKIPQKIKCLTDERKRKSIPLFNIVMLVLLFLMLQYESFHTIFSASESMSKRLKNCISGRIPKVDAVRDLLSRINPDEIRSIHEEMIDIIKRNRVFREGTIGGYIVAGLDGVELFSSTKKSCPNCLTRKKAHRGNRILLPECGVHDHRKITTRNSGAGNVKTKGWFWKRLRRTDRRKKADRAAEETAWAFCGCDCGRCVISECPIYQHTEEKWSGRGDTPER